MDAIFQKHALACHALLVKLYGKLGYVYAVCHSKHAHTVTKWLCTINIVTKGAEKFRYNRSSYDKMIVVQKCAI